MGLAGLLMESFKLVWDYRRARYAGGQHAQHAVHQLGGREAMTISIENKASKRRNTAPGASPAVCAASACRRARGKQRE
jgi:hypothetical protein